MERKYIVGLVLVAIVALIALRLYSNKKEINAQNNPKIDNTAVQIPVIVDTVTFYSPCSTLKKTGNVAPFKQAVAYASSPGNIIRLHFDLGTFVSAGQLMAITDPGKPDIDLSNALAKEKKLKNELDTYIELLEGKATTQEKVNQLRLDYVDAQNQVAHYKKQVVDTRILAPVSGIVTDKKIEQGVYVNTGTEIATIVDIEKVKVQVYLTEAEAVRIKKNDIANITSELFPGKVFKGKVTYISPQGDATHSYLSEITIDNSHDGLLKSGAFVYVDFTIDNNVPVPVISREALLENTQAPTVYVVKNNKVTQREIRTGKDFGDKIEVLSDLSNGETVVVSGQINLSNGTSVKITNINSRSQK